MRVLHIVAAEGPAGAESLATAEVLLATMVSQDPDLLIDEIVLPSTAPAVMLCDPGARGRLADVPREAPWGDGQVTLVGSVLVADVIVLSVGDEALWGHPAGIGWMLETLTRPEALRARAEVRRSGRRVGRRMVAVGPPVGDVRGARDLAEFLLTLQAAFRCVDVTEFGVIAGGTAGGTLQVAAPAPDRRAVVRWWTRSRITDRKAS
jgi:hypothetical protein